MGLRKADGFIKKHGKKIKTLLAPVGLDKAHMEDMTTLTSLRLREVMLASSLDLFGLHHHCRRSHQWCSFICNIRISTSYSWTGRRKNVVLPLRCANESQSSALQCSC